MFNNKKEMEDLLHKLYKQQEEYLKFCIQVEFGQKALDLLIKAAHTDVNDREKMEDIQNEARAITGKTWLEILTYASEKGEEYWNCAMAQIRAGKTEIVWPILLEMEDEEPEK